MQDNQDLIFMALRPGRLGKNDPLREGNDTPLRTGGAPYSGNVYYYWFHFVRLYQQFEGSPKGPLHTKINEVYADFGVPFATDFYAWWRSQGGGLMGGQYEEHSRAHGPMSVDEFAALKDGIAIFFPFDGNLDDMLKDAEEKFRKARESYYVKRPELMAKYAIHGRRYEIASLHNKMIIYEAVMNALTESFVSIFRRISHKLDLRSFEGVTAAGQKKKAPKNVDEMLDDEINKLMSKDFEKACRLAYHAARGEFPNFERPQGPYNRRKPWTVCEPDDA